MGKMSKDEKVRRQQERRKKKYEETHKIIENITYKLCSDCGKWLPLEENYYINNQSSFGYNPYCKECTKDRARKWTNDNHEKSMSSRVKSAVKFKKENKERVRETEKARREREAYLNWQINNRDKLRQYAQKRHANKAHEITNKEWESCKEYFNYECAYCGLSEEIHKHMYKQQLHKEHVDHIGSNKLDNCVPSCKICNVRKHTSSLEEWYNDNDVCFNLERLNKINKWLESDYKLYITKEKITQ